MRTAVASDEPEREGIPVIPVTTTSTHASWVGFVRMEDIPYDYPPREPYRTQAWVEKPKELEQ